MNIKNIYWVLFLLLLINSCRRSSDQRSAVGEAASPNSYKAKALLIGLERTKVIPPNSNTPYNSIATSNTKFHLDNIASILNKTGYQENDIIKMTNEKATGDSILNKLKSMTSTLNAGDQFVFYFTGHGDQFDDNTGYIPTLHEPDGKNEGIISFDRMVLDDELYETLKEINENVEVIIMMDCCHSGSMYSFNYDDFNNEIITMSKQEDVTLFKNNTQKQLNQDIDYCQDFLKEKVKKLKSKVIYFGASKDEGVTPNARISDTFFRLDQDGKFMNANYSFCELIEDFAIFNEGLQVTVSTSESADPPFFKQAPFAINYY